MFWANLCAIRNRGDRASLRGTGKNYAYDALTRMYDCPVQHAPLAHKFTGKERDNESGLDNFGARYFSSQFGRFMSLDLPSYANHKNPQTWNLYTYSLNNPVTFRDTDGHKNRFVQTTSSSARRTLPPQRRMLWRDSRGGSILVGNTDAERPVELAARLSLDTSAFRTAGLVSQERICGLLARRSEKCRPLSLRGLHGRCLVPRRIRELRALTSGPTGQIKD